MGQRSSSLQRPAPRAVDVATPSAPSPASSPAISPAPTPGTSTPGRREKIKLETPPAVESPSGPRIKIRERGSVDAEVVAAPGAADDVETFERDLGQTARDTDSREALASLAEEHDGGIEDKPCGMLESTKDKLEGDASEDSEVEVVVVRRSTKKRAREDSVVIPASPAPEELPARKKPKHTSAPPDDEPVDEPLLALLKRTFHLDKFREFQRESIEATLDGKDTFVISPTASGKSLCFQLPAVVLADAGKGVWHAEGLTSLSFTLRALLTPPATQKGATVVLSPTKALIADQAQKLRGLGISVQVLGAGGQLDLRIKLCVVLLTPEKFFGDEKVFRSFKKLCEDNQLARFAIDEAHYALSCHGDFRPVFSQLSKLRTEFPDTPIMALTASISTPDRQALMDKWRLRDPVLVAASTLNRENIEYLVQRKESKAHGLELVRDFVQDRKGQSGIIYAATKPECDKLQKLLQSSGHSVDVFHGGEELSDHQRTCLSAKWGAKKVDIMVATNSFGLGVDRQDVRYVIHYQLPQSITSYYQESSRCGRDGAPATSLVLFAEFDAKVVSGIIHRSQFPRADKDFQKLKNLLLGSLLQNGPCIRALLLAEFDEAFDAECGACEACRRPRVEETDVSSLAMEAILLVRERCESDDPVTLAKATELLRGAEGELTYHIKDISRLLEKLLVTDYLNQAPRRGQWGVTFLLDVGAAGEALLFQDDQSDFSMSIHLEYPLKTRRKNGPVRTKQARDPGVELSRACYVELSHLAVEGIEELKLRRLSRLLPCDGDELFAKKRDLDAG
ncbi:hypothetical protein RQP46_003461 [Phenoliferia psychrophenolica]